MQPQVRAWQFVFSAIIQAAAAHAAETARARGQRSIRLDCLVENTIAHKLYLSHGFQIVGETEMYYEDIGERRKFLMFERVITD